MGNPLQCPLASLVVQLVKNLPAMWEIWVQSLCWKDPLEKGKFTHSSILAFRIPWTVSFMGSQKIRHDWVTFTSLGFKNALFESTLIISKMQKSIITESHYIYFEGFWNNLTNFSSDCSYQYLYISLVYITVHSFQITINCLVFACLSHFFQGRIILFFYSQSLVWFLE